MILSRSDISALEGLKSNPIRVMVFIVVAHSLKIDIERETYGLLLSIKCSG